MLPAPAQSVRLFRVFGITVFLHYSWFLIALYEINYRKDTYTSLGWNIAEYLGLFCIVLLHEFGHALASRQVGGSSDRIVLWPLGGVAYVSAPPRPGAELWSIAAGPLVNVVIALLLKGYSYTPLPEMIFRQNPELTHFIHQIWRINLGLLIFNILPIYPLDGGQILRSLLWFVMGRVWSLYVACSIGLLGVAGMFWLGYSAGDWWFGLLGFFALSRCWRGFKNAKAIAAWQKIPRHNDFACPSCRTAPPQAAIWRCAHCQQPYDTFAHLATCPNCGEHAEVTACPECRNATPLAQWSAIEV